jgi:hypothetical protein
MVPTPFCRAGLRALVFLCPWVLLSLTTHCSGDGSSGPTPSELEVIIVSGNHQFAPPGTTLREALRVLVREVETSKGTAGARVDWILEGGGGTLTQTRSFTDSAGLALTLLTLGGAVGTYTVRAAVEGMPPDREVIFEARAVDTPIVESVPTGSIRAGEPVAIQGRSFWPEPRENVVLFSGVRGRVLSADAENLQVQVPPCLPTRDVQVTVAVGEAASVPVSMSVREGSEQFGLGPGEDLRVVDADGLSCLRLKAESGATYLGVVTSGSTVGGALYGYALVGLAQPGSQAFPQAPRGVGAGRVAVLTSSMPGNLQTAWERRIRKVESGLLATGSVVRGRPPDAVPGRVPAVGEQREFNVLNKDGQLQRVTATVRWVGLHSVIYEDVDAPPGGLSESEYTEFAAEFDDPTYAIVTGAFGRESDLDANGRIVILFTPVVNQLTPPGSDGFVGGFFFGLDLLRDREGSNQAEVFYTLVPDPEGQFGDRRDKSVVLGAAPAVLAHELQHMVHFNERVLKLGATNTDALWLSEGLAQMAEDLVSEEWRGRGHPAKAAQFGFGNWLRAHRYLRDPGSVSLVIASGNGTLEERGAGWLFMRYLYEHGGREGLLGSLTRTTRTGVANVTAAVGLPWEPQLAEWTAALYVDGLLTPTDPRLEYPQLRLRDVLNEVEGGHPLRPRARGGSDFQEAGELRSSAPDFYLLEVQESGSLTVNLAGPLGGAEEAGAKLQLVLVRVD